MVSKRFKKKKKKRRKKEVNTRFAFTILIGKKVKKRINVKNRDNYNIQCNLMKKKERIKVNKDDEN